MFIRPVRLYDRVQNQLENIFGSGSVVHIDLAGDIGEMVKAMQVRLELNPKCINNIDFFTEELIALDKRNLQSLVLSLRFREGALSDDICVLLDALERSTNLLNMDRELRLSIVVFI